MRSIREALSRLIEIFESYVNDTDGYSVVAITGGVGYEDPPNAWFYVRKGVRYYTLLTGVAPLGAGLSYTSSVYNVQDNAGMNYEYIIGGIAVDTNTTINIKQGMNGTDWDYITSYSLTTTAGTVVSQVFKVEIYYPYVQIEIVNDDTANAQTVNRTWIALK